MLVYPPFGFSVWYDRHRGFWRWRERRPTGNEDDVTHRENLSGRMAAIQDVRDELRRRGARDSAPSDAGD